MKTIIIKVPKGCEDQIFDRDADGADFINNIEFVLKGDGAFVLHKDISITGD